MACLFGHNWNGCKCKKCGEVRAEGHNYERVSGRCFEKCEYCGDIRTIPHEWDGCKCTYCGVVRDSNHSWDSYTCSHCGRQISIEDVRTLTDPAVITNIAKSATDMYVRWEAAKKTDSAPLIREAFANLATNVNHPYLRNMDLLRYFDELKNNQALLIEVANNAEDSEIRMDAANRIEDKDVTQRILKDISNSEIFEGGYTKLLLSIADRITDKEYAQEIYRKIAEGNDTRYRTTAASRLDDNRLYDVLIQKQHEQDEKREAERKKKMAEIVCKGCGQKGGCFIIDQTIYCNCGHTEYVI